jgi:hypothetical protein
MPNGTSYSKTESKPAKGALPNKKKGKKAPTERAARPAAGKLASALAAQSPVAGPPPPGPMIGNPPGPGKPF